jgi:PST family polysaccharide transporter
MPERPTGDRDRSPLGTRAVTGFAWAYGSFMSGRVMTFLATLVLARLLVPEQFGLMAFALAVLAYMESLTDLGVGSALIYRSDANEPRVASTAFWIGMAGALVLMTVSWFGAPLLALVGPGDEIVALFRVLSLQFLLSAFGSVPEYLLRHNLGFKSLFGPELAGALVKGMVSIGLALAGSGVWSLVVGQLSGSFVRSATLLIATRWRPRFMFDRRVAAPMIRFGIGISAVGLIGEAGRNGDYLFVGAQLGSAALGLYFIAFRLPELLILTGFRMAQRVLFPFYSRLRDLRSGEGAGLERDELSRGYLRTLHLGAFVSLPLGFGIAALAGPIVLTLFGERWERAIVPMALIGIWAGVTALTGMPGSVFKALGRSGVLTATAIVQVALTLPALWVAAHFSIEAVAAAHVGVRLVNLLLSTFIVSRLLETAWVPALVAMLPALALSVAMAAAVYPLTLVLPSAVALVAGAVTGLVVYVGLLRLLRPDDFRALAQALDRGRRSRGASRPPAPGPELG